MNNANCSSDSLETAIEGGPRERRRFWLWRALEGVVLAFCSESALIVYILFHWLLACGTQIAVSDHDTAGFISFLYFMSTLISFLSIMSHVSGLLIPLFCFSTTAAFVIFLVTNLAVLSVPGANSIYNSMCGSDITRVYCKSIEEHALVTLLESYTLMFFYMATCAAIIFQFARNDEYARNPPQLPPHHFMFYPQMVHREVPVGAINIDEPPRYSTLEPLEPKPASLQAPSTVSTVTSPPRYSYWERTFGRQRSPSSASTSTAREPDFYRQNKEDQ